MGKSSLEDGIISVRRRLDLLRQEAGRHSLTDERVREELDRISSTVAEMEVAAQELAVGTGASREVDADLGVLEFAPAAFLLTDQDGMIRWADHDSAELLGMNRRSLIGKPLLLFVAESWRSGYLRQLEALSSGARIREWSIALTPPNAPVRDVSLSGSVLPGPEGNLLWLIGDGTSRRLESEFGDASRRVQSDEEQATLAGLILASEDAAVITSPDGKIQAWNPAAERIFGYRSDEVIGRDASLLYPRERTSEVSAIDARVRSGERIVRLDTQRVRKDGTLADVRMSLAPLRDHVGAITAFVIMFRDTTSSKRQEDDRRTLEKLQRDLVGDAAHALRGPITSLTLLALTLSRHREELPERSIQDLLGRLGTSAERINLLVGELFDLARLGGEADLARIETVDIADVIASATEDPSLKGGSLEVLVPEGLVAMADRDRLRQAVGHLLDNASRHGGSPIRVGAVPEDGLIKIFVSDEGRGVPPDLIPRLFEPFQRGPNAIGPGLGLSIVRKIVDSFGGRVWYEPGRPRGARFVIQLLRAD